MATVRFLNTDDGPVTVEVPVGTSLLEAAQRGHAPEGSACGGGGAGSAGHMDVRKGPHALRGMEDEEDDILDKAFAVESTSRLGCQARIAREGVLEVEITRESYEAYYNEHPQERRARDERRRLAQVKG